MMTSPSVILLIALIAIDAVHGFKFSSNGFRPAVRMSELQALEESQASQAVATPLNVKIAGGLINALFSIKPLFKMASGKARSSMVERGAKIGVDWVQNVNNLERDIDQLTKNFDAVSSKLQYPDYYLKPFHAYDEGNLSWQVSNKLSSPSSCCDNQPIELCDESSIHHPRSVCYAMRFLLTSILSFTHLSSL